MTEGRLIYPVRWLILISVLGGAGCASIEYKVPAWEVQRLTELPPALRGNEIRVVPANAAVPPPPAPVVEAPPPPEAGLAVEVDVPIVVGGPGPPVVAGPRRVGPGAGPRGAPVAGSGGWKSASSAGAGGWKSAPSAGQGARPTHVSSGGGHHGGGGGGGAAAVAGAAVAVGLIAILIDASSTADAADAARQFNGWVSVEPAHLLHLYYAGGSVGRIVPLAALGPRDLIGLEYAVLAEDDGHVEPLSQAPPAAQPPVSIPPPISTPPPVRPPSPPPATSPVSQAVDRETP